MEKQFNPCYAIVPAAGSSRRMGQPKLLLPWPDASRSTAAHSLEASAPFTIIDRVLAAWTASRVTEVVVVVRGDDDDLRAACQRWPVTVVQTTIETSDMKGSVCVGLRHLALRNDPGPDASCFIAPADLPGLSSQVIDRLIDARGTGRIVVRPRFGETLECSCTGHPALLPWELTVDVFTLAPHEGIDALIKRHPEEFVLCPTDWAVTDIDTPDEYIAALKSASR